MKSLSFFVLFVISFNSNAYNLDNYADQSEYLLYGAVMVDWAQTRWAKRNYWKQDGPYELNPILGKYPSTTTIDSMLISSLLLHYYVNKTQPSYFRSMWNTFWVSIEIGATYTNYKLGIKAKF